MLALDLLAKAGANIHVSGKNGITPLEAALYTSIAATDDHISQMYTITLGMVQILVQHGALVGIGDAKRKLYLKNYMDYWKFIGGDPRIVHFLIAEGVPAPNPLEMDAFATDYRAFKSAMRESDNQGKVILSACDQRHWFGCLKRTLTGADHHVLEDLICGRVGDEEGDEREIEKIKNAIEEGRRERQVPRMMERALEHMLPVALRTIIFDFLQSTGPQFENDAALCTLL